MSEGFHIHPQLHVELIRVPIKPDGHLTAIEAQKTIGDLLSKAEVKPRSPFPGFGGKEIIGNQDLTNLFLLK